MRKLSATAASLLVVVTTFAMARQQDDGQAAEGEERIPIKPDTALAALVKEVETHEMTKEVAARSARAVAAAAKGQRRKVDIEDWLKAHYLRNHPEARVAAVAAPQDPTEGFPLALESLQIWMLRHQDLRPDPSPKATAAAKVGVGKNVRVSGKNTTPRSESDIRINFGNPKQIIAGSNNLGESRQAQFFSGDGGATWGQTTLPLLSGDSLHSDPTVDWTSDGTAWATTIGIDAGSTDLQMRAYRSTDGGQSWTFDGTFSGNQTSADKQMMWVDRSPTSPFKDTIYVIWHNNRPAFINRRLSSGWQAPIPVSGPETTGTAIGSDITTNAAGEVFAVWPDTGSQNLFFVKSTDGGATFTRPPVAIARTFGSFQIAVPSFARRALLIGASLAAFRNTARNDVYASWTDLSGEAGCNTPFTEPGNSVNSNCKSRVWFTRSIDGGAHWEVARQVNPSPDRTDQFNQKLAVDPDTGTMGITYYGTGTGSGRKKTNLFFQASVDNGATWGPATKVTTATTDETTGTADLGNQYGDYNGLSVANGVFFPCWTDRSDNRAEAIFTARIGVTKGAAGAPVATVAGGEEAPAKKKPAAAGAGTDKD